ncbi:MAG TPA: hypothetical protein VN442_06665 [Bryobacteraceae bacterium]|nr:hypothetical protein [Bryobacteraceae bacterium]
MQADRTQISRAAILVAGFAVGALSRALANSRQGREISALRRSLAESEARLAQQHDESEERFGRIEARLDEHETRLNDVPSTVQIVAAMEELLSKTMQPLNHRLSAQSDSIELLKTTVAQTDGLLERVLESLDSLRQLPAGTESKPGDGD